jgi:predicted AAA+ superfamily ATPase
MIARALERSINEHLFQGKVILLMGARQTGKTTLMRKIAEKHENILWLNGDEYDIKERFRNPTSTKLKSLIGDHKLVFIDEAQQIDEIGISLKLLYDNYPDIQLIVSGSSSFELRNRTNEPLTGRKIEFQMFPISFGEMSNHHSLLIEKRYFETRMIYGYYPEIINKQGNEINLLKTISDSYLYKDILMLENLKKPEKLMSLLQALAFQIGSELSYNEISNHIGLDSKTVESYIDLLEKSFVVFRLRSFSRNLRNELKLSKKVYFYDNGIRNAIISNFQMIEGRMDKGALFENMMLSERIKFNHYSNNYANRYFWRTKNQQEIDYIEDKDGQISGFEFKLNDHKKFKISSTFLNAYPEAKVKLFSQENYEDFLT